MKKKNIIIALLITSLVVGITSYIIINLNLKKEITIGAKNEIIKNLTIKNENILKEGNKITIKAKIKNNNATSVEIKAIKVNLFDENNVYIGGFAIKINKSIDSNKKIEFSKTVKINTPQRVFTKYEIKV